MNPRQVRCKGKGETQTEVITLRCTKGLKYSVEEIATSEGRSSASYIKGLILADMKKRDEV